MEKSENVFLPKMKKFFDKIILTISFKNRKQKNTNNSILGNNNVITNNNFFNKENEKNNGYDYFLKCSSNEKSVEFGCELHIDSDDEIIVTRNEKTGRIESLLTYKCIDVTIYNKDVIIKEIKNASINYGTGTNKFYISK